MNFLNKSIEHLLENHKDLENVTLILPGKRPVIFIKQILEQKKYTGFLPEFYTIEELIKEIASIQELKGIALWLYGYEVYRKMFPAEDFSNFLKWFPTLLKDWDDILKFTDSDKGILEYMLDEERIKNWGEDLGDDENPRKKNLNFWKKMNDYLPQLRTILLEDKLATSGMISEIARKNIPSFAEKTNKFYAFLGFNAFTPVEELLIKNLLQWNKADAYFHSDHYYFDDKRQEAGKFLRQNSKWKEFNEVRDFKWVENDFKKPKNIKVYEVSGNISQTKILPDLLADVDDFTNTAVILLDENLLPATLDAVSIAKKLNITMGFPLKNLSFSNAIKNIFYLQKQLVKRSSTYYYNDILPILEEMPKNKKDKDIAENFLRKIEEKNIVYISPKLLKELLGDLSFYKIFQKQEPKELLTILIKICQNIKFENNDDDILYENVSHFEKTFKIIQNQLSPYEFYITIESLEVLINQLINSETIDFQGEPLEGLQVMGLLETRLLNFKNIILLSVNEGKLPLGNSQNTYLPFDVRRQFGLNTFIENDGIYAYHFYRLLQDSQNVHLLFNALSSGVNTGEKSRFITQLEVESNLPIEHIIIENPSEPSEEKLILINKDEVVKQKLDKWKEKVSVSNLTSYLYNPIDFYFSKVLGIYESDEIEEELSQRNYGQMIHFALEILFENYKNKILTVKDLELIISKKDEAIKGAIKELNHQEEFYEKGMNFIHKSIATKILSDILHYDLAQVKAGKTLEILDIEKKFENIELYLDDENSDKVYLNGYIDRIDRLNGKLRIIDYKTAKTKNLTVKIKEEVKETYFHSNDKKQAMQLCLYQHVINQMPEFSGESIETGIWSFAEVNRGVVGVEYEKCDLDDAMVSIKTLIKEILNTDIPFEESTPVTF